MIFRSGDIAIDVETHELRRNGVAWAVEPQVFDLAVLLMANHRRLVTKDEIVEKIWRGRAISDATLSSRIRAVRNAIGDDGKGQSMIRTVQRRGFRFVGPVTVEHSASGAEGDVPAPLPSAAKAKGLRTSTENSRQDVQYCRASDGVRLAYAKTGSGPPLVKAGNWLTHLEFDWLSPVWGHVLNRLSERHSLLRYDARGCGLSDWETVRLSLEAWVSDLEAVVDAAGFERFPLLGICQGCPVAIAYAVRHPHRVSKLILYGGRALGAKWRCPQERRQREAMATLVRLGWGQNNPAFRHMFTELFVPDATAEQKASFNEMQRNTTSPECAARFIEATTELDVTDLLSRVRVPTLVMHAREDAVNPVEAGRELAGIPGARFVELPGRNHLFLEHEPAAERFFEEIALFLAS